jgi:hypothetical protein
MGCVHVSQQIQERVFNLFIFALEWNLQQLYSKWMHV